MFRVDVLQQPGRTTELNITICPAGRPFDPEECALVLCSPCRDEDCPGNQICCLDGCCDRCVKPLAILLPPVLKPVVRPGTCPAVRSPPNCDLVDCRPDACLHDGLCSENEKCCSVGCCKDCVKVIPEPVVKPGQCPVSPPGTVGICILECSGDEDCAEKRKCCSNGCGLTCQEPARNAPKPGQCPPGLPFDPEECAVVLCRACADEDCPAGQRCCLSGCCPGCVEVFGTPPKPIVKPGRCPVVPPAAIVIVGIMKSAARMDVVTPASHQQRGNQFTQRPRQKRLTGSQPLMGSGTQGRHKWSK